jgi:hypothetical protein
LFETIQLSPDAAAYWATDNTNTLMLLQVSAQLLLLQLSAQLLRVP